MGLRDIAISTFLSAITAPRDTLFEREMLFAEANPIVSEKRGYAVCGLPPSGWWCSREAGHAGPCAAHRSDLSL